MAPGYKIPVFEVTFGTPSTLPRSISANIFCICDRLEYKSRSVFIFRPNFVFWALGQASNMAEGHKNSHF